MRPGIKLNPINKLDSPSLTPVQKSQWIKSKSEEYGFLGVGISKANFLKDEAERLQDWLMKGYHGKMTYMENHFEKRTDPRKLVEGAKSIICFAYNYYPESDVSDDNTLKVARYAYGRDYHKVLKKKLIRLLDEMQAAFGPISGRCFVDSAPVMEREWALRSGLGWIGKNTLIIHPKKGSYFFLAEIILDIELAYDSPISDHCGTCTRCIDACPTKAISENGYELNASECISYLTIELADEEIPAQFEGKMDDWIFGCDICQEVCPWNKFSTPHDETDFAPRGLENLSRADWEGLTQNKFDEIFFGTPVKRTGYNGLKRNIQFVSKKS